MEDWPPPIAKGLPRVQEKLTEYFYPTSENQQQLLKAFFFSRIQIRLRVVLLAEVNDQHCFLLFSLKEALYYFIFKSIS